MSPRPTGRRGRGRGASGPTLTVIWWADIPAQVTARAGDAREGAELPARFQKAIDAVAMRDGLAGTDAYLQHWTRTTRPCGDDLAAEVAAEVAQIDSTYDHERLTAIIARREETPAP